MKIPGLPTLPDAPALLTLATRAVIALERIATATEMPPTRKTGNHPGGDAAFTDEFRIHVKAGCELVFIRPVTGPAAWCEDHNVEVPLLVPKPCCCTQGGGTAHCGMCAQDKHEYCDALVGVTP